MNMKADNVAEYLLDHPEFFNEHAELLVDLVIQHPYGGRTISLSERQILVLRERNKELEKNMLEWMALGRENEALENKLHLYMLAILGAHDEVTLKDVITRQLTEIFSVPHAILQLWKDQLPSAEMMTFAESNIKPVCSHQAVSDTSGWFGERGEQLSSFAYLPLRNDTQSIGMLVLASEDGQRFYPEMGTVYLQRIAEMVSKAVQAP